MENSSDNLYNLSSENFRDKAYDDAVKKFPKNTLVYLNATGQVGMVEEVRAAADGPRIRVSSVGSVPITEIRFATKEEIENSRFKRG